MKRIAKAHWNGSLEEGKGEVSTQSKVLNETRYSFKTRFADGMGTNPEELIAAAHAGCFSMALSATLSHHHVTVGDLFTTATVDLDVKALNITGIHLDLRASLIEGIDESTFIEIAEGVKADCIISKALNVPITLSIAYA